MRNLFATLVRDEAGFIVSAELILVSSIAVLSLVVGLTEISTSINNELNDVASAFGSINQSYSFNGLCGTKGHWSGSRHKDCKDQGDGNSISCNNPPQSED